MYELMLALENLLSARDDYRKAWEACDADHGYFTHRESEAVNAATARFKAALDSYVDGRVAETLRVPHGYGEP